MNILAFIAVLLPIVSFAYVNPGAPQGFVNDFADMLSAEEERQLEDKLSALSFDTTNEIAVVTVPNLGGDTIENFAVKLFEEWGLGQKEDTMVIAREDQERRIRKVQDNGMLLLISRDDRAMRIEVGYGLEGTLTDAQSFWIMENVITPEFKKGNFYTGIDGAVDAVSSLLSGGKIVVKEQGAGFGSDIFLLFLFIPIWLASILGRSKSWWLGGVLGGIGGVVIGFIYGFLYIGVVAVPSFIALGLLFDFFISRSYSRAQVSGVYPWWIGGHRGGGHFGGGGGFGGFGGGRSGGGGVSGRW
ncbi:MAG: TPM domain-containing protein [bacterium]|nr:TPM domain-containing protein [bacterium]